MHIFLYKRINYGYVTHYAYACGGTAAAAPPPSGLATLPSVGAVP